MEWLWAPDSTAARFLLERGIAAIYVVAFVCAARQFPALLGERGLQPAPAFIRRVPFRAAPSIFHVRYSDRALVVASVVGAVVAASLVVGIPQAAPLPVTIAAWALLWLLYLSIVNIGQTFYSFGWESLLLEAGFLAIFLGNADTPPPFPVILAFRWLTFRLELGAGLIKLRGDRCWRDLSCMDYHHETQPMPNPLSWFFHHAPKAFHRVEIVGNFVAQLALPFALFLPQPFASLAAAGMIATQAYLVVSGNYAWLNWLTIVVACSGFSDDVLRPLLGGAVAAPSAAAGPGWFAALVLGLTALVVVLSYWPTRNLLSRHQRMNAGFNPFHLVNTYGAFGTVTRRRDEIVVEGTSAPSPGPEAEWREYEFKGKPGDPRRPPRQWAPYHLRLDWLMWFIPLAPGYAEGWFVPFLGRLLENDQPTLRLLRRNPFPDAPPTFVRAVVYRYRFTTWREWRQSGAWWVRERRGEFVPPLRLRR